MGEHEVYYLQEEKWWQKMLPVIERYAKAKPGQIQKILSALDFILLYNTFVSARSPRLKAACFYLLCLLIKKDFSGNLPFYPLKDLYLKCPLNYEPKWSISAAMHIAKFIPEREQAWILSLPCPHADFPEGYAPE